MNLTEKGGVALHFFASDRSRRNYIDALPGLLVIISLQHSTIVRGKSTACAGEGGWHTNKRVTTPRSMGGLGHLLRDENYTTDAPHLKNGGRGRAQWPGRKIPPANINPPMFGLTAKNTSTKAPFLCVFM